MDIKTAKGIWPTHIVQLSGYEKLDNENRIAEKIDRRAILRLPRATEKKMDIKWISGEDIDYYFRVFLANLQVLNAKQELRKKGITI